MLLNPSIQLVDLVITDRGKELLSQQSPDFKITKFAVSDDMVDYQLYDTSAASSDQYGHLIKALPCLEASTFASTGQRYKCITLPPGTTKIPILKVNPTSLTVYEGQEVVITPSILNYTLSDEQMSFTAILRNSNLGTLSVDRAVGSSSTASSQPSTLNTGTSSNTVSATTALTSTPIQFVSTDQTEKVQIVTAKTFKFTAAPDVSNIDSNSRTTTIEVYGNVVGGGQNISVTVVHSTATSTAL